MSSGPHIKRDLAIVMIGRVLQMATLLLMLRAMTARLSPAEVGNFSLLTSIATLFEWVLISPVGTYVNRHTLDWRVRQTLWVNYAIEAAYMVAVAIFTGLAVSAWMALFGIGLSQQFPWVASLLGLYVVIHTLNMTIIPGINLLGKRIAFSGFYVATQILCLGFSWWFTSTHPSGEVWFIGQLTGFSIGLLIALPYFVKITAPDRTLAAQQVGTSAGLKDLATFTLPIAVTFLLNWVQFQSYRMIVGNIVSLDFLGLFFAGYSASAGIMAAVEITASQFFSPYFYKHAQESSVEQRHEAWVAYMAALYPLMIVIVMVMIALCGPIAHILLSHKYASAAPFIAVGATTEGIRVMANTYGLAAQAFKRTQSLLMPYCIGAGATVIGLIGGTLIFGERAVGPAMVLASLVFLASMHIAMTRLTKTKVPFLGAKWVTISAAILITAWFVIPALPLGMVAADILQVAVGGIVIVGAFLFISRDSLSVLARFA